MGGGLETLMLVPMIGGILLLSLLCVASHARAQVAAARRGQKWRAPREASVAEGSDSLSEPLSSTADLRSEADEGNGSGSLASRGNLLIAPAAPSSLLRSAQMLESLSTAMLAEKHKYRSKQHVHRLYLTGSNSATQPWRLPLLPPELRSLMSETQYYMISG